MHRYEQSTGRWYHDDTFMFTAYSGRGVGVNNPALQQVHDTGPIPVGRYIIGPPEDHPDLGPYAMPLTPLEGEEMFGRSGFYFHGDNSAHDMSASKGCIIKSPRSARQLVWLSGDNALEVVRGPISVDVT